ncbi:metal-dependent transcriptional regulator [Actinokineospora sp.]|uniref:metal-dependent transcriptional regulator n=1 Tax=Actinokineospora sp. TaxID=1872133 RepID=UPI004037602D
MEDALKAIFSLSTRNEPTTTSALAGYLGIAPPTATAMCKRLSANGLAERTEDHQVTLTDHGLRHALDVVRRHRLLEQFLAEVLAVPWDEVHDEAEVLEHAVSDALVQRIDAYLGHPTHDPHGDPIPPRGRGHVETWTSVLADTEPGATFLVERISDRDSAALRYLGTLGIRPGVLLDVVERAPFGGPLWVRIDQHAHGLGPTLTRLVHGSVA